MTSHVAQQIKFGRDTAVDYRYHFLVDIKWQELTWRWPVVCVMIIRKCETCDIPKPAGAVCQWARAPAPFTMAVCVSCLKWPVMNGLPRQTHNAQSHSFSYMGVGWHPWHRRTSSQPSEVPCKVICYKHTTHLDSTDNPNEFKWPSTLLLSLFCTLPLSLLGIPQVLTSCSDSWIAVWPAHTWFVVSQGWQVPSVFWGIYLYIYQHYLCLCIILKRFWVQIWSASCCSWAICGNWWCLLRCMATSDPCDLFLKGGRSELRPVALVTNLKKA